MLFHPLLCQHPDLIYLLPADRYEGEFQAGYAHGLGMMTSEMRGEVHIGEFFAGQKHG